MLELIMMKVRGTPTKQGGVDLVRLRNHSKIESYTTYYFHRGKFYRTIRIYVRCGPDPEEGFVRHVIARFTKLLEHINCNRSLGR